MSPYCIDVDLDLRCNLYSSFNVRIDSTGTVLSPVPGTRVPRRRLRLDLDYLDYIDILESTFYTFPTCTRI